MCSFGNFPLADINKYKMGHRYVDFTDSVGFEDHLSGGSFLSGLAELEAKYVSSKIIANGCFARVVETPSQPPPHIVISVEPPASTCSCFKIFDSLVLTFSILPLTQLMMFR